MPHQAMSTLVQFAGFMIGGYTEKIQALDYTYLVILRNKASHRPLMFS